MRTPRRLHIVVAAILALGAFAGLATAAGAEPRPTTYVLPGTTVYPEGVAFQESTGDFFVSSTTDGTIFRGNVKESTTEVFLPGGEDGRTFVAGVGVSDGLLYLSGGATGMMFVYDIATAELVFSVDNNRTPTFVNDVAITADGAFFTDSMSPILYRVYQDDQGQWQYEEWLNFTGTPLVYTAGFNLNGIEATPDGKYLIVVKSNTGELFRISLDTKAVMQIDVGGAALNAGDGLLVKGHTLYVLRNSFEEIVKVQLSGDYSSGYVVSRTTDDSFQYPTTMDDARGRLLVVNSQFNQRATGTPVLPFNVSSVKLP